MVDLDGKRCEWGDIDMWRCYAFYTHAGRYYNPFVPKEVFDRNEGGALDLLEGKTDVADEAEIMKVYTALQKYFPAGSATIWQNAADASADVSVCWRKRADAWRIASMSRFAPKNRGGWIDNG